MIEWKDENGDIHSGEIVARKNNFDIIDCQLCGFKHAVPLPSAEQEMLTTKISIMNKIEKSIMLRNKKNRRNGGTEFILIGVIILEIY